MIKPSTSEGRTRLDALESVDRLQSRQADRWQVLQRGEFHRRVFPADEVLARARALAK
jgi:hypothetical protein